MKKANCKVEVDWYGDRAFMKLREVAEKGIQAVALEVEGQAKININKPFQHANGEYRGQIDTGAMVNSVRAEFGDRIDKAPPGTVAAVNVPVEYAPYQESLRPFLYPAVEEVSRRAEAIINSVARMEGMQ